MKYLHFDDLISIINYFKIYYLIIINNYEIATINAKKILKL